MEVAIGIPNSVPGITGQQLVEWARRAERAGFAALSTIGAVDYPNYEELTVFAAAAAVTERIRLFSNVLIAPARSTAELAKQAATVDQLSGGRLTLGLGVGWRRTDYQLTGRDFADRGKAFDEQLRGLQAAWAGEALPGGDRPVAPPIVQQPGVPLLIGGTSDATIRRVVEFGVGWTAGGMPPDVVREFGDKVRAAWKEAGRSGAPRISALLYYGLGDTVEESRASLIDYYKPQGDEVAQMIADSALRSPDAVRGAIEAYTEAGADQVILDPTVADVAQVDLLAEIVFS